MPHLTLRRKQLQEPFLFPDVLKGYESNCKQGRTEIEASTVALDQLSVTSMAAPAADQPTRLASFLGLLFLALLAPDLLAHTPTTTRISLA